MSLKLRKALFSLKTTAVLLFLMLAFLTLNVAIPQQRVVGRKTVEKIAAQNPLYRFLLEDLGLSQIPTSPPFLVTLLLFYVQLTAVVFKFASSSINRVRFKPGNYGNWQNVPMRESSSKTAYRKLIEAGFRIVPLDETAKWGVRNRISPIGFLLFHISFLALLCGGVLIHYTRFAARISLVSEYPRPFVPSQAEEILRFPLMPPPAQPFEVALGKVEARKEKGEPVLLKAEMKFSIWSGTHTDVSLVNSPAQFMGYWFLPQSTDDTMTFRVFDSKGYLLDTLVIMSQCRERKPSTVALPGNCSLTISCVQKAQGTVQCNGDRVSFPLVEGRRYPLGPFDLELVSVTPWVSFLVVYERGPGFLILGFLLNIVGLVFRFIFPRQDVIITTDAIYFKGEYFPHWLKESLEELRKEAHDTT